MWKGWFYTRGHLQGIHLLRWSTLRHVSLRPLAERVGGTPLNDSGPPPVSPRVRLASTVIAVTKGSPVRSASIPPRPAGELMYALDNEETIGPQGACSRTMRKKPHLQDERTIACLRESHGLTITGIEFLLIGNDSYAGVYRVNTDDGHPYFLKVGPESETSCL
jgi:hypothetical protein